MKGQYQSKGEAEKVVSRGSQWAMWVVVIKGIAWKRLLRRVSAFSWGMICISGLRMRRVDVVSQGDGGNEA